MSRKMSDDEAFANLTADEQSKAMWHRGRAEAGRHGVAYHTERGNDFQAEDSRKDSDAGLDGWNAALNKGRRRG